MSLRWRRAGELLCGAKSSQMPDDTYIDDKLHYKLSVELGVVVPRDDEKTTGRWDWVADVREARPIRDEQPSGETSDGG